MRTFGIEIECIALTKEQARDALNAAGIECQIEHYNHITRQHWKITTDSSVSSGIEIVSPILSGDQGFVAAARALDTLHSVGARINKQCGFHVHVGASDLTAANIATIARRYAKFEDQIDAWMAPSRRADANRYCRSVRRLLNISSVNDRLSSNHTLVSCGAFGTRYMKVNLESYNKYKTIEFRQHGGTVESAKALPWIRFCLAFVEQSRVVAQCTNSESPIPPPMIPADTKVATIISMLSRTGGASIGDLTSATGWVNHTVRGVISTYLRKRGHQVVTKRQNGTTIYTLINVRADVDDTIFAGVDQRTADFLKARTAYFSRIAGRHNTLRRVA